MITLSSLRPHQDQHHPKRVGRGNASGKGTTAGRGTKGQRARSGGRNKLIRKGLKHMIERTPKTSGWHSRRTKFSIVQVADLNRVFSDGQTIKPTDMLKAGLYQNSWPGVKVIGADPIKKKLMVTANSFSVSAAAAITKAGGTVTKLTIKPPLPKKVYDPLATPGRNNSKKRPRTDSAKK